MSRVVARGGRGTAGRGGCAVAAISIMSPHFCDLLEEGEEHDDRAVVLEEEEVAAFVRFNVDSSCWRRGSRW